MRWETDGPLRDALLRRGRPSHARLRPGRRSRSSRVARHTGRHYHARLKGAAGRRFVTVALGQFARRLRVALRPSGSGTSAHPAGRTSHQSTSVRHSNRVRLLQTLLRHPARSRADLGRTLGLSRATVTALLSELEQEGMVEQQADELSDERRRTIGRPPLQVSLAPHRRLRRRAGLRAPPHPLRGLRPQRRDRRRPVGRDRRRRSPRWPASTSRTSSRSPRWPRRASRREHVIGVGVGPRGAGRRPPRRRALRRHPARAGTRSSPASSCSSGSGCRSRSTTTPTRARWASTSSAPAAAWPTCSTCACRRASGSG